MNHRGRSKFTNKYYSDLEDELFGIYGNPEFQCCTQECLEQNGIVGSGALCATPCNAAIICDHSTTNGGYNFNLYGSSFVKVLEGCPALLKDMDQQQSSIFASVKGMYLGFEPETLG